MSVSFYRPSGGGRVTGPEFDAVMQRETMARKQQIKGLGFVWEHDMRQDDVRIRVSAHIPARWSRADFREIHAECVVRAETIRYTRQHIDLFVVDLLDRLVASLDNEAMKGCGTRYMDMVHQPESGDARYAQARQGEWWGEWLAEYSNQSKEQEMKAKERDELLDFAAEMVMDFGVPKNGAELEALCNSIRSSGRRFESRRKPAPRDDGFVVVVPPDDREFRFGEAPF